MAALTYAQAGVDRDAADRLVEKIGGLAKTTLNRRVKSAVGGYASLFELDKKRWLAASTDGVGTKLKLAFQLGDHSTVGIDLVAMSVNDLLCVGAEPLFFLDYFATGRLENHVAEQVIAGIVEGCRQAKSALVGGETAEMPDFYAPGEYDLGGFAVGFVEPKHALPRKDIRPGDVLIGLPSKGTHSNGYSLLRKLLPSGAEGDARARELLTPTQIYVKALSGPIKRGLFKGLAHITGSGFLNIPRMSSKVAYEIEMPSAQELPRIYDWVRKASGLGMHELYSTFNMGIGMVGVVAEKDVGKTIGALKKAGQVAWRIGHVVPKKGSVKVRIREPGGEETILEY